MSGHDVMTTLWADPELRSIPVSVQTGSDADRDVVNSFDLDAHEFVTKPLRIDEFKRVVEYVTEMA